MKKTPFNLTAWLKDKSQKVVNSKDKEVRIICWDREGEWPIIGLTENRLIQQYNENGVIIHFGGEKWEPDLFLVTEDEPELTEFERAVFDCIDETVVNYIDDYTPETRVDLIQEQFEKWSDKLLSIARKQIEADGYIIVKPAFLNALANCDPSVVKEVMEDCTGTV